MSLPRWVEAGGRPSTLRLLLEPLSFSRKCISYGVVVSLMYTHKLRSLGSVRATPAPRAQYFHLAICLVKTGVRLGKRHVFRSQNSSKLRSVPSLKEIWTCTPASFCEKWPLKTVARLKLDGSAGVKMILIGFTPREIRMTFSTNGGAQASC